MKNIPIDGSRSLPKPDNVPDDQHEPIHVVFIANKENEPAGFIMAWLPNKEDKDAIAAGRPILVKIPGTLLPNVELFTMDEKGQPNS